MQHRQWLGLQSGQANIAVALHGFFQAAEKQMDRIPVELGKQRAIEHHRRPVDVDMGFKIAIEVLLMSPIQLRREFSYRDRAL
jgi:signal transduction histidine kinase